MSGPAWVGLDANILVHATDPSGTHYDKAREVVVKVLQGGLRGCLSQQVLAEYFAVLTGGRLEHPLSIDEAKERVLYLNRTRRIKKLYPKRRTFRRCMEFCAKNGIQGRRIFDALYAFTLLDNGVRKLLTRDAKDFRFFEGQLEIVDPFHS